MASNERWLNGHGSLGLPHAETLRIKKYVQSHYLSARDLEAALAERGWADRPDAVTEVWWESLDDMRAGLRTPQGVCANAELEKDEQAFCDMERMQAFFSREALIVDRSASAAA